MTEPPGLTQREAASIQRGAASRGRAGGDDRREQLPLGRRQPRMALGRMVLEPPPHGPGEADDAR